MRTRPPHHRRTLRKPQSLQSASAHNADGSKRDWMEVWLPRLSHIAQFGLFLFTLGSLYFTVLPLYQKALLDESIAKKEIELKTATVSLEQKYSKIRAFAIKEYVIAAGAKCSGLLEPVPELTPLGKKPEVRPSHAERIYAIDVTQCL